MAGYSGIPLPRKLGIKDGHVVCLVGAPDDIDDLLDPLPKDRRAARAPR